MNILQLNIHEYQEILGLGVAIAGFMIVAFAYEYPIPSLDIFAGTKLWFNGFFGLSLIIIGIVIAVKR